MSRVLWNQAKALQIPKRVGNGNQAESLQIPKRIQTELKQREENPAQK